MAWTVILEDEQGSQIDRLTSEFTTKLINDQNKSRFSILKYLDPYGDTTINAIQANDLLIDLSILKDIDGDNLVLDDLIDMAKKCTRLPHTYIVFYGD